MFRLDYLMILIQYDYQVSYFITLKYFSTFIEILILKVPCVFPSTVFTHGGLNNEDLFFFCHFPSFNSLAVSLLYFCCCCCILPSHRLTTQSLILEQPCFPSHPTLGCPYLLLRRSQVSTVFFQTPLPFVSLPPPRCDRPGGSRPGAYRTVVHIPRALIEPACSCDHNTPLSHTRKTGATIMKGSYYYKPDKPVKTAV